MPLSCPGYQKQAQYAGVLRLVAEALGKRRTLTVRRSLSEIGVRHGDQDSAILVLPISPLGRLLRTARLAARELVGRRDPRFAEPPSGHWHGLACPLCRCPGPTREDFHENQRS